MQRLALALCALLTLPAAAHEPADWIDRFPDVTSVAQVALDEYQAELGTLVPEYTWRAANVAGTFTTLREIIELKQRREWFMSAARKQKLRQLIATYQEAELAVGQGWLARAMADPTRPPGVFCPEEDCYRLGLQVAINARSGSASYRRRILARLFPCGDLAAELDQLRQAADSQPKHVLPWFWMLEYMPSPAHTLSVEPDYAGLAPAGCTPYGGDADRDGLCDGWESAAPGRAMAARGRATTGGRCIELIRVLMAEAGGLKVGIAAGPVEPGSTVEFRVAQATSADGLGAQVIWQGTGRVCEGGRISAGCPGMKVPPGPPVAAATIDASLKMVATRRLADVVMASAIADTVSNGGQQPPDAREPENWPLYAVIATGAPVTLGQPVARAAPLFLVVDAISPPAEKPVSCERPSTAWPAAQSSNPPGGLHGPYTSSVTAVWPEPGATAIRLTRKFHIPKDEYGFLVLRKGAGGAYYTTPPFRSSQGLVDRMLAGDQPVFPFEDYYASFGQAFENSCEDKNDFVVNATVHSHIPSFTHYQDNFSLPDFEGSIAKLANGDTPRPWAWPDTSQNWLMTALKGMYMLDSDHTCLRFFELTPNFVPPASTLDDDARLHAWRKTARSNCR